MKFAIKSILKMKNMGILMILILSFSISLINNSILMNLYTTNKEETFKNFFDVNSTYLIRVQADGDNIIKGYKYLDDMYTKLLKLKGNGTLNNIYLYGFGPNIIDISPNTSNELFSSILIDKNFIDRKPFKITKGRPLTDKDFSLDYKTQNIPIILGSSYSNSYELGHTFSKNVIVSVDDNMNENYLDLNFEVVGFADDNQLISLNTKSSLNNNFTISNSVVIIPCVNNVFELSPSITLGDFGAFFEIVPNTNYDTLLSSLTPIINDFSNNTGVSFKVVSSIFLRDDMASPIELLERDSIVTKALSIILILLSSIGIVTILLLDVETRKKEFGIKITQGASYFKLFIELIQQVFMICIISTLISYIISFYINKAWNISWFIVLINFFFIVILTTVISILPVLKLKSIKPIDLLRGI